MKDWQRSYCRWLRLYAWVAAVLALFLSICLPGSVWGWVTH